MTARLAAWWLAAWWLAAWWLAAWWLAAWWLAAWCLANGGVQDVEVPARVDIAGERSARPVGLLGTRELPLIAVVAAFLVAVLLGVGIGYATADRGTGLGGTAAADVPVPELSPAQRPAPWTANRVPGAANQMLVTAEPDPAALRLALQWAVADQLKAANSASKVTAQNVTVVKNMLYFGAVEGVDAAHDVYWAIGRIEVGGTATPTADTYVWRRVGAAPWTIVSHGPGACGNNNVPAGMLAVFGGPPQPCGA
ncbi:hypothetical protein [Frankia sp. AgB32]|uniref:hypothetical protein n=1 Tax=Frankia sp. AgB32 TaxID=631119 RepID=UPI00200F48F8|nr:hypothetical protein [Frankia sp. AgB32]MCK9896129.1 hypothetical protein [Frankia sp. AgB32]